MEPSHKKSITAVITFLAVEFAAAMAMEIYRDEGKEVTKIAVRKGKLLHKHIMEARRERLKKHP